MTRCAVHGGARNKPGRNALRNKLLFQWSHAIEQRGGVNAAIAALPEPVRDDVTGLLASLWPRLKFRNARGCACAVYMLIEYAERRLTWIQLRAAWSWADPQATAALNWYEFGSEAMPVLSEREIRDRGKPTYRPGLRER